MNIRTKITYLATMSTFCSKKLTRALSLRTLARNCSKVMDHSETDVTSSVANEARSWEEKEVAGLARLA